MDVDVDVDGLSAIQPDRTTSGKRDDVEGLIILDPPARGSPLGSDTCPKEMSNEPKAAGVAITLPFCKGSRSCDICFKDHMHYNPRCSYRDYVPQGATVGPRFEVICQGCCSDFIVAKWVCSFCGGRGGKVFPKHCRICNINRQHSTEECPVDPVAATKYKLAQERQRQVKALVPVKPSYVPPPPPGFVNMEEAMSP